MIDGRSSPGSYFESTITDVSTDTLPTGQTVVVQHSVPDSQIMGLLVCTQKPPSAYLCVRFAVSSTVQWASCKSLFLLASQSKSCSHGAPHERHVTRLKQIHIKCVRRHAVSLPLRPVLSDARFSLSEIVTGSVDDSSLINAVQPPSSSPYQPFKLLFIPNRLLFFTLVSNTI